MRYRFLASLIALCLLALPALGSFGGPGGHLTGFWQSPSSAYDPDATTLFAAMSVQPDDERKALINDLIVDTKACGVWSKLDLFYVTAAHDSQAAHLNWKSPSTFTLTPTSSPTFTVDSGYNSTNASDGTGPYLDTGWDASTNGVQFTQNSASVGVYTVLAGSGGTNYLGRISPASGAPDLIQLNNTTVLMRINAGGGANVSGVTHRSGHTVGVRAASTGVEVWRDGVSIGTDTNTSTTPDTNDQALLRQGLNSTNGTIGAAHWGGALTNTEVGCFYTALQAYMTAVIPTTATLIGCTALDTNLTTYSFAAHAIGAAGGNRTTVVGILAEDSATTFSINSGTINAVAATMIGTGANDTGSLVNARFMALNTATLSSTTTIAFTLSEAATGGAICVWAVYNLQSLTPFDQNQDFETSSASMTLDVNTTEKAVVLGIAINDAVGVTTTWTGLSEEVDAVSGEYARSSAIFHEDGTAATPLAITSDYTGTGDAVGKTIVLR